MGLIFLVSTIHEVKEMGDVVKKKTWYFFIAGGHLGPSYTENGNSIYIMHFPTPSFYIHISISNFLQ